MPTETIEYTKQIVPGVNQKGQLHRIWTNSPRVAGVLHLQPNAYTYRLRRGLGGRAVSGNYYYLQFAPEGAPLNWASVPDAVKQVAYSKFRGKLYKGNAALGVTLGSYKQSREMIVKRAQQLGSRADAAVARLISDGSQRNVAGIHLEVIFGWMPLLADIVAATATVCQQADFDDAVTARHSGYLVRKITQNAGDRTVTYDYLIKHSVAYSTLIRISNPNLWLLERAGLLNPLSVVWDLVPWSFVVNMFVNVNQLVNSVTDFAGLTFSGTSVTETSAGTIETTETITGFNPPRVGTSLWGVKNKGRTVGAIPRPPMVYKVPDANWNLAAMATSLLVQKIGRLSLLIPSNHRV